MIRYVVLAIYIIIAIVALRRHRESREEDDDCGDCAEYDYLTVREQIAEVKEMSDALDDMEQLQTDLAASNPDDMIVVSLHWIGRDGQRRTFDVYCDGLNLQTESLLTLSECEAHMIRAELQDGCKALARRTSGENPHENNGMPSEK